MKRLDLAQTIAIFANVGVIIGIAFLAIEINQNNALMQTATREAQNERIQAGIVQLFTVPGLAETIVKANNGEQLTEVEELQLFARKVSVLRGFEAQYREIVLGAGGDFPLEPWTTYFNYGAYRNPPLYDVWEEVKPLLRQDFVQYFEENVVINH